MRSGRIRRRFKFILIVFLTASMLLFLESRIESFAPQIRQMAELKIEEAFDNKFILTIGGIDGGIVRPIILNDCRIADRKKGGVLSFLRVTSISSNYRIWDLFLADRKFGALLKKLETKPYIDIRFQTQDGQISGFARLEGKPQNVRLKGWLNLFNEEKVDFKGAVAGGSTELELETSSGMLKAKVSVANDSDSIVNLTLNHVKAGAFDIVCDAVIKNILKPRTDGTLANYVEGSVETRNFILNYKPFRDLKAGYTVKGGMLIIQSAELGNNIKAYGTVVLKEPYSMNLTVTVDNVSLGELLSAINARESVKFDGMLSGKFEFKGSFKAPKMDARFDMRKGSLADVEFDSLTATLKGDGPIVRIEDSRVTRANGYFKLGGYMDFSKAGKGNIFSGIDIVSEDSAVMWDGLNTKKVRGAEELEMRKKMTEDINFGFKKTISDERVDESLRGRDEFEVGYKMQAHDSLKVRVGEDDKFFGYAYEDKF